MNTFTPTPQQDDIIKEPATSKILVLAGAGTGKTETLVRRLERLLAGPDLRPKDMLVLSFSRAAVRELHLRLRCLESEASYVRARTFDSFATRLLRWCRNSPKLEGTDYEERIRLATEFIKKDEEAQRYLSDVRQIVVDEMQDLVGARQEMVRALLEQCCTAGFTLFADPAQSIYDYKVRPPKTGPKANEMLDWLRQKFGQKLITVPLDQDFRFETDEARTALWARQQLLSLEPNYESILKRLRGDLRGLRSFTLEQRTPSFRGASGRLAILCRSNAQILAVSRELYRLNVPHAVQREQTDRCIVPWVAVVFRGATSLQVSKSEFLERCQNTKEGLRPEDPELAWRILRHAAALGTNLHLGRLNERLRAGDFGDELNQVSTDNIVLSTVHRAKGLQFAHVMVADPEGFEQSMEAEATEEEARVLYVALTRARRVLERLNDPRQCYLSKDEKGRYRGYSWRNPKFPLVNLIEFSGSDIYREGPAGSFGATSDVLLTQQYIQYVQPGDKVKLKHCILRTDNDVMQHFYVVRHLIDDGSHSVPIGITSEQAYFALRTALWPPQAFGRYRIKWPDEILGLRVETIETVAGQTATSRKYGLGEAGLWLRVRVSGLGHLRFAAESAAGATK